ncbi:MAG: O-antigen ligase family protein [Acidobacteriota bacterium]
MSRRIHELLAQATFERAAFVCLAGSIALALLSIAASQILLAAAIGSCAWAHRRDPRDAVRLPAVLWPLLALFLWTLAAALVSYNVLLGLLIVKKFYLFLILFLVPAVTARAGRRLTIYRAVFATAAISALAGVAQFAADPHRDALHRISGFMSQWMTYSGLLMLALVALGAYALVSGLRRSWWALPVGLFVALAIYLSQTRNAWMGATAGLAIVLLLLKRYRSVALLTAGLVVAYLASPAVIQQRFRAGFDLNDPNTRNRVELFETAGRLIRDNPWFGVGPKNVGVEALRYRGTQEYPDWMYQHLHNNFLQIAAERGIPGLGLWLWFIARLGWDALSSFRRASRALAASGGTPARPAEDLIVATAALGGWVALLLAGLFEYNFGDSEVLTLFLFMMSAPYADLGPKPAVPGAGGKDGP